MRPHFLLVGNGPYLNRGCEAIVRGTVRLVEHFWGSDFRITLATIAREEIVSQQAQRETDSRVKHVALGAYARRLSLPWWFAHLGRMTRYRSPRIPMKPRGIDDALSTADVVLEVGGDNYSLHYGRYPPYPVVDMDRYIMARSKVPIVIWGSSIGPFTAIPRVAHEMFDHLRAIHAITVRETATFEYLRRNGVSDNVHLVADPAFLMEPSAPADWPKLSAFVTGAIGVNLSPLLTSHAADGDASAWVDTYTQAMLSLVRTCGKRVVLVPHVTVPEGSDYSLMTRIAERLAGLGCGTDDVLLLADGYTAAELKHIIGQLSAFIGARMHATVAAISSGVPTLALSYSTKSVGLFRDVYGDDDHYIQAGDITPEAVAERVGHLLEQKAEIRELLVSRQPEFRERALRGGEVVRHLLEAQTTTA